jgi:hypothetical protein
VHGSGGPQTSGCDDAASATLQSASLLHGLGGAAQIPHPTGWPFGLHDMKDGQSFCELHWTGPSGVGPASAGPPSAPPRLVDPAPHATVIAPSRAAAAASRSPLMSRLLP